MIRTAKRLPLSFLVIVILFLCTACSDSDSKKGDDESIIGSWRWYETSGGIGGIVETPSSTGETRKVVFEENGDVTFYTNDDVTFSSTFTLSDEITVLSDQSLPVVKVQDHDTYVYSFPYVDELELQEAVIDGFIHNYRKE